MTAARHSNPLDSGFVLLPVILILGILASVLATLSLTTTNSMTTVRLLQARVISEASIRAALENVAGHILSTADGTSLTGHDRLQLNESTLQVSWASESGRVDVNVAAPELLASLFQRFGASSTEAETYAGLIVRRRQTPESTSPGPQAQGGTPIRHIRELSAIGIPETLVERVMHTITIYSGTARIDPRIAPVDVIASLPGVSEARMRGLFELRAARSSNAVAWMEEAGEATRYLQFAPPRAMRLRIAGHIAGDMRRLAEVVIVLFSDDREPYRVLDWQYLSTDKGYVPLDSSDL